MKAMKISACALAVAAACTLAGCSSANQGSGGDGVAGQQATQNESGVAASANKEAETTTPDAVLDEITADFETTNADIVASLEDVKSKAGGSYADYAANKDMLTNWFSDAQEKADGLYARTRENSKKYFTLLADQGSSLEYRDMDDAMKAYYRAVYDDAFKSMYRDVYTDAFKDVYRTFYEGVMKEAYDVLSYSEASDAQSDLYRAISDAQSDFYQAESDAQSGVYEMYSDVYSKLYNKEYDLSSVLD